MSPKRISYLGPEGTFTDQACHVYAPDDWERVDFSEMHNVVGALVKGEVDEAIVPIENSVGGSVIDITDFLVKTSGVQIRGEMLLGIEQCLIAHPGVDLSEIKVVRSKPEALSQCREFLDTHVPKAARVGTASTVEAVYRVKGESREVAAIGPRRAAELADLPVIREGIQDGSNNVTRFVILASDDHEPTGTDKTEHRFQLHESGHTGAAVYGLGAVRETQYQLDQDRIPPGGRRTRQLRILARFHRSSV